MNVKCDLTITYVTHVGNVRKNNEDTIGVGVWSSTGSMEASITSNHTTEKPLVVVVADGIGGHQAGEIASKYVVERVLAIEWPGDVDGVVEAYLQGIHNDIRLMMQNTAGNYGMGTTVVGVILFGNEIVYFNIGDSRLYKVSSSSIKQLSVDDRPQVLGAESDTERFNPRPNVLTQALGGTYMKVHLNPHMGRSVITSGNRFLLCSDGLTDMVSNEEILNTLAFSSSASVQGLLQKALENGGDDNISAIIIEVK